MRVKLTFVERDFRGSELSRREEILQGEIVGLLALMFLTDARRAARTGPNEEIVPLDKQDRILWDQSEISEGTELLTTALSKGAVGLYQLQAAIAAGHDEAARVEDTDWPQIFALYELLKRVSPSPLLQRLWCTVLQKV